MVTKQTPHGQAGASNTRLDSQNNLQVQLDYLTFTFTQPSSQVFNETLRALALFMLPAPILEDWATTPKSRDYKKQYKQYQEYKKKQEKHNLDLKEHSILLDLAIMLAPNKPYALCKTIFYPDRLETLLPLTGGYKINPDLDGQITSTIRISGKFWGALDLQSQISLLQLVAELPAVKVSRIDVALDDFSMKIMPYDSMVSAAKNRQYTGIRKSNNIENHTLENEPRQATLNLGSKESPNFYRCYWKSDRIRLEREIKQKEAHANFLLILEYAAFPLRKFAIFLAKTAIGSLDFVARNSTVTSDREKNINRCDRFPWWQEFINMIGEGLRLKLSEPVRLIENTLNWLDRQVIATVTAIHNGLGREQFDMWLYGLLRSKQGKQSPHHQQITEYLKAKRYAKSDNWCYD